MQFIGCDSHKNIAQYPKKLSSRKTRLGMDRIWCVDASSAPKTHALESIDSVGWNLHNWFSMDFRVTNLDEWNNFAISAVSASSSSNDIKSANWMFVEMRSCWKEQTSWSDLLHLIIDSSIFDDHSLVKKAIKIHLQIPLLRDLKI